MDPKLQTLCEQFILNRDLVKKTQKMCGIYLPPVCAHLFCTRGKTVDEERLKACLKLIRKKTGVFSNFRSTMELAFACMLSLEEEPELALEKALSAYDLLKKEFMSSQYLPLAAFLLKDETDMAGYIARGREIYLTMRKEHPFLTSTEDSVFAVMMAFSEKDNQTLVEEMEACYTLLKKEFRTGNSVQTVSHVLAISGGTPAEKTGKLIELYEALRQSGLKYSKYYEVAALAAFTLNEFDLSEAVDDILEVDKFLEHQKGYGVFSIDKGTRLMHAVMLVSADYAGNTVSDTTAVAPTLAMIAAQQAAMCAVIASSAAVTAANAN